MLDKNLVLISFQLSMLETNVRYMRHVVIFEKIAVLSFI